MNRREEIEIVIHPDGGVEIEAFGFEGRSCEEATGFLVRALGAAVSVKRKPEYYRQARRTNVVRSSAGRS